MVYDSLLAYCIKYAFIDVKMIKMSVSPLVSIIMPAYNAEKYIESSVESVLGQDYENWELIIVNDGSEDFTSSLLEKYSSIDKIRIVSNARNKGVSRSRALGISLANGKYIAFLDSDDVFENNKLRKQVSMMEKCEDVHLCHSNVYILSEEKEYPQILDNYFNLGEKISVYEYRDDTEFMTANHICNSSVMVRKETLDRIEVGIEQLFQVEDWFLWILLSEFGKYAYLPERLIRYRYHLASATSKSQANRLERQYFKVELYLSVISRSQNQSFRHIALRELRRVLMNISKIYSKNLNHLGVGIGDLIDRI